MPLLSDLKGSGGHYLYDLKTEPGLNSKSVGDTLAVGLTETVVSKNVQAYVADTLSLTLSEAFTKVEKRHLVAFDTVAIALGEQQYSRLSVTVADTLDVEVTGEVESASGTFQAHSVADTLDIEVDDPGITQAYETADSLSVGLTDASNSSVLRSSQTDSLDISVEDSSSVVFTGTFTKAVSDSLGVQLTEAAVLRTFKRVSVSDSFDLALGENASLDFGVIISYLQGFDTLNIDVDESPSLNINSNVVAKSATDSLLISLDEVRSDIVSLFFFTVEDTLNVALVESNILGKTSRDLSWEEADFPWGGSSLKDIKPLPVFVHGFDFYQVDSGDNFVNEEIQVILERLGLTIYGRDRQGNWKEDPDLVKLVKKVVPIFRGSPGTVINIFVGAQDSMEGGVTWDGPHEFVIGRDTFVTPLISGKFIAIRFESLGQKQWSLLSYDLDIKNIGRGL